MRGLRTQENSKFMRYFALVQNTAAEKNCIFFLDSGQGNMFEDDTLECEDLSGWLIPSGRSGEFESEWAVNKTLDNWIDFYCWAEWRLSGGSIEIEFKFYG